MDLAFNPIPAGVLENQDMLKIPCLMSKYDKWYIIYTKCLFKLKGKKYITKLPDKGWKEEEILDEIQVKRISKKNV